MVTVHVNLVPGPPQDIAAVCQEMAVGREDFKGDGVIEAALLQGPQRSVKINIPGAKGQVQIGMPTLVVMEMDVAKTLTVCQQDFCGCIVPHHQVGMADIQMKSQRWHRIEQLAELLRIIEVTREVLDHQPHTGSIGMLLQFV